MFLSFKLLEPENKELKKFMELLNKILNCGTVCVDLSDPRVRRILRLLLELLDGQDTTPTR